MKSFCGLVVDGWYNSRIESLQVLLTFDLDLDCDKYSQRSEVKHSSTIGRWLVIVLEKYFLLNIVGGVLAQHSQYKEACCKPGLLLLNICWGLKRIKSQC